MNEVKFVVKWIGLIGYDCYSSSMPCCFHLDVMHFIFMKIQHNTSGWHWLHS